MPLRSLTIGFAALGSNPLRTLLSTLGVVIGVASLVAVLSLGDGLERFAREQIERTTSVQTIEVAPNTSITVDGVRLPGTDFPRFSPAEAASILEEVPGVAETRLSLVGSGRFQARGTPRAAIIMGSAQWPAGPVELTSGRWFTPEEVLAGHRVVVVSPRVAELLAGDSLVLEGRAWSVIGVSGAAGDSMLRITAPITVAHEAMVPSEWPRAPSLLVKAARVESVEEVRGAVERWLAARNPAWPAGSTIRTSAARARQTRQGVLVFKLAMGAITSISLLVGGIGIMNVLLASVAERTREIGVRKATGARHRDILLQFLSESVAITGAGSLIGVVLGLAAGFGITAIIRSQSQAQVYAAFAWQTVLVAVAAAVVVGVVFGMYPALRAARLSPIDAIRHE